jgi:hypothetical protein
MLNEKGDSTVEIKLIDIFLQSNFLNNDYASFYKLFSIKKQNVSSSVVHTFDYLKINLQSKI